MSPGRPPDPADIPPQPDPAVRSLSLPNPGELRVLRWRCAGSLTVQRVSDRLTDMKVNSRDFQRDFARMKAKAAAGETVHIVSDGEQFIFQAVRSKTWQGALKGKARITGDLFSTGLAWETSR